MPGKPAIGERATAARPAPKTKEEQILMVNQIMVKHPHMLRTLDLIEECRLLSQGAREPECLLILGQSGVGKTTLKDHYLKHNPKRETPEGTMVPVLTATIPVPATMVSMATALLLELGDPGANRGTLANKTTRLYKLINDCQVELIILDEFQHFKDRENNNVLRSVSDWLKNLITAVKRPVVLTGLQDSRSVIDANDQLRRRFSCQKILTPFEWDTAERKTFQTFLSKLDELLPFPERSNLKSDDIACRMYAATDGLIAHIMKIIRGAAYMAIKAGADRIDLQMLERSYDERILQGRESAEKPNPFSPGWKPALSAKKPQAASAEQAAAA